MDIISKLLDTARANGNATTTVTLDDVEYHAIMLDGVVVVIVPMPGGALFARITAGVEHG